jgi:hypothetical protein
VCAFLFALLYTLLAAIASPVWSLASHTISRMHLFLSLARSRHFL